MSIAKLRGKDTYFYGKEEIRMAIDLTSFLCGKLALVKSTLVELKLNKV